MIAVYCCLEGDDGGLNVFWNGPLCSYETHSVLPCSNVRGLHHMAAAKRLAGAGSNLCNGTDFETFAVFISQLPYFNL
jgi:hypothetical protein